MLILKDIFGSCSVQKMRIKVAQYRNTLSYLSSAFDLADSDSVQFLDVVRSAATLAAAAAELAEVTVAPRKNWKNIYYIFKKSLTNLIGLRYGQLEHTNHFYVKLNAGKK
jgi:hypothetical protein